MLPHVSTAKVGLQTASVYPEPTAAAFELAASLGYDGVEVMVWGDPVSQDVRALRTLSDFHGVPILALHAPCLVISQRVWGSDPWAKLLKAKSVAEQLGAEAVVVHPPFRWQRDYAAKFLSGLWGLAEETDVVFAVENMFPLRARGASVSPYSPDWDPTVEDFPHFTLDLSHTSVSRSDALAMRAVMGDRLSHVHIADGLGTARDEHLVPGRGSQPCAELLEGLVGSGFAGLVVAEINTRKCETREERENDLAEALAFTRLNLAAPAPAEPVRDRVVVDPARSVVVDSARSAPSSGDPLMAKEVSGEGLTGFGVIGGSPDDAPSGGAAARGTDHRSPGGHAGRATAFDALVDDYDLARPGYPTALFDALPALDGRRLLELGAGTGKQTAELLVRGASLVSTDLGPGMLGRLHRSFPDVPVAVCAAEQLPFADASFDGVCGAQMWHWVDVPSAAREAARVLQPGGWLAVWWNDVVPGAPWFEAQQDRLEAMSPGYRRSYRARDYGAELAALTVPTAEPGGPGGPLGSAGGVASAAASTGDALFTSVTSWTGRWSRQLDWPTYAAWLRSKSYVAAIPDLDSFLAAEQASLEAAFPGGRITEDFDVHLWVAYL